jgi:hypothetical protein
VERAVGFEITQNLGLHINECIICPQLTNSRRKTNFQLIYLLPDIKIYRILETVHDSSWTVLRGENPKDFFISRHTYEQ